MLFSGKNTIVTGATGDLGTAITLCLPKISSGLAQALDAVASPG